MKQIFEPTIETLNDEVKTLDYEVKTLNDELKTLDYAVKTL